MKHFAIVRVKEPTECEAFLAEIQNRARARRVEPNWGSLFAKAKAAGVAWEIGGSIPQTTGFGSAESSACLLVDTGAGDFWLVCGRGPAPRKEESPQKILSCPWGATDQDRAQGLRNWCIRKEQLQQKAVEPEPFF